VSRSDTKIEKSSLVTWLEKRSEEKRSKAPDEHRPLVRVLEKRELLSQVLAFMGEGTEIASMLVCKDVCKFVRLLRGWQEEKKEEEEKKNENMMEQKIVCGMSVSRVSRFVSSVGLMEWGADVLDMPITDETMELAVRGGHVCTLAWLLSRGVLLPDGVCDWAADAGDLSMLQYLRSLGPPCPWDGKTCMFAARNGHLDVLQWARSQPEPCPWDWRTYVEAAENGHLHVLQWAWSQVSEWNMDPTADYSSTLVVVIKRRKEGK
jgi:hypothetical protein